MRTKKNNLKSNFIWAFAGAVAVVLILGIAFFAFIKPKTDKIPAFLKGDADKLMGSEILTSAELLKATENVSELTTQKYHYKDIAEDKKEKDGIFSSEEQTLIVYSGMIHVGIRMDKVSYDIDNEAKEIKVKLPKIEILSHEVDEKNIQSYDVKKGLFSKGKTYEELAGKFAELKDEKEKTLLNDKDFLNSVQEDTETTVKNLLEISGITEGYIIKFA